MGVPGAGLQMELLFCMSSSHGNVAPCWGTAKRNAEGLKIKLSGLKTSAYLDTIIGQSLESTPEK